MKEYKKFEKFPERGDIVYGTPINYHRLSKHSKDDYEIHSLADPHYMIVLRSFKPQNVLTGVWVTSKKPENEYPDLYTLSNILVLETDLNKMGLSDITIVEFNARNINFLPYTNEFFYEKDNQYKLDQNPIKGKLTPEYLEKLDQITSSHVQLANIAEYFRDYKTQILPLRYHQKDDYRLPNFELIYNEKENKNKKKK
jgi:hypothetical protein